MQYLYFLLVTLVPFVLSSDVLVFNDANFESSIQGHSIILVEFYAPWCGHCKQLAPEYEIAATKLKNGNPPISIAKVDCTAETKTCQKYDVSGYPTLKVFKDGKLAFDYGGERNADGIVKYMISKSGPACKELKTKEDLTKFLASADPVILGFYDADNKAGLDKLKATADKLNEDFRFGQAAAELGAEFGFKNEMGIFYPKKLHSKFESKFIKFDGTGDFTSWIENNVMGLAGVKSSSTVRFFTKKPLLTAFYNVDYEKDPKGTNYWRNRIIKVAKKFMDANKPLNLAIANSKDLSFEMNEFGITSPEDKKVYITIRDEKSQKFKMDKEFSMSSMEDFLTSYFNGQLTPYLKSEEVPADNSAPLKVVVAQNFQEIVNDPTKDVLIEFYAPWCGHCKSLAPKYEELATKMAGESNIVIAKMDATANDVPSEYQVQGFPTIYFAPKKSKSSPKQYQGGREVDDFIKYLAEEATEPLSGYDRQGRVKKSDL